MGVAGSLAPFPILGVPVGYVSGSSLRTSTDTWDDATFASLGVTPGLYTWTWGSRKDADSFRLIVAGGPLEQLASLDPPSIPEPATWTLMAVGQANYIVTLTQRGSDVVETGNGSLDLTGLLGFRKTRSANALA